MERRLLLGFCLLSCGIFAGCSHAPERSPAAPTAPPPPLVVDAAAQKAAYERGVGFFGREKYVEARAAWRDAVRLGPEPALAAKAREHLRKLERMLATLQEIQNDSAP